MNINYSSTFDAFNEQTYPTLKMNLFFSTRVSYSISSLCFISMAIHSSELIIFIRGFCICRIFPWAPPRTFPRDTSLLFFHQSISIPFLASSSNCNIFRLILNCWILRHKTAKSASKRHYLTNKCTFLSKETFLKRKLPFDPFFINLWHAFIGCYRMLTPALLSS